MNLKRLDAFDKEIFDKFLSLTSHELSVFAFENIYIWNALFEIGWTIIEDSLCVFFKDKSGCFLYLPPLEESIRPGVVKKVFEMMDTYNRNEQLSRIENIEENNLSFFKNLGYGVRYKSCDYICKRDDIAMLKGDRFKTKRKLTNYFTKHFKFEYAPFCIEDKQECLELYESWSKGRKDKIKEPTYQYMLDDLQRCLNLMLDNHKKLDIIGRVVRIDKAIKAFTFGFELDKDTFCILYEIAELSFRGMSQFIFRQFCSELKSYKYINIMDDSGLENLTKVKLSYHPVKLIPAYIVTAK